MAHRTAETERLKLWQQLEDCRYAMKKLDDYKKELEACKNAVVEKDKQLETLKNAVSERDTMETELDTCKKEQRKLLEELSQAKKDAKAADWGLIALRKDLAKIMATVQDQGNALTEAQKKLEESADMLKNSTVGNDSLRRDLSSSVKLSFANAVEQIKLKNPGIKLDLSGVHHFAYIKDGLLIPPSLPPSESQVNEDPEVANVEGQVNIEDQPSTDEGKTTD